MRVYEVDVGTDTPSIYQFVTGSILSRGGQIVLRGFLYQGHFVSGGFCPRWFFDWGAYCAVALSGGFSAGGF